jgi:hypothetical protein
MPLDSLSEQDRLRLARLIRAPLIPPAKLPRRKVNWQEIKAAGEAAAQRLRIRLASWSVPGAKRSFSAHCREWAIGSAAGLACLILIMTSVWISGRRDHDTVGLEVRERQGRLQIHWDTGSDLIQRAIEAKLFITDGPERLFVTLDVRRLRVGAVNYMRRSGRVELRMTLKQPDGRTVDRQITFFGRPSPELEEPQLAASASPGAATDEKPSNEIELSAVDSRNAIQHRARRRPLTQKGTSLPFTCSPGDVFRKIDAPQGWDTFICRGKNVWGVSRTQPGRDLSIQNPNTNATTPTPKPASASTT